MTLFYIILGGSVLLFGASAVYALSWAIRRGQLENFQRGATSIFDPGEPLGQITDRFPGEAPHPPVRPDQEAL